MITLDLLIHDTNRNIGNIKCRIKELGKTNIALAGEVKHLAKILEELKGIQDMHDEFYTSHKDFLKDKYNEIRSKGGQ